MTYLNNFVHKESITKKSISKENYQEKIKENFFFMYHHNYIEQIKKFSIIFSFTSNYFIWFFHS